MAPTFHINVRTPGGAYSLALGPGEFAVGSDPSAGIVLECAGVSPRHATLWLGEGRMQVEDLGTPAETLVNGYDISGRVEVGYPATLQCGPAVLEVEVAGLAAVAEEEVPYATAVEAVTPDVAAAAMGPRAALVQVEYALRGEIARGGMGRIYCGEDPQLKREVAVKISGVGGSGDPRFMREAEVLASLAHPNIVPIHAIGQDDDGFQFYSMKLVKGRTLQSIVNALRAGEEETAKVFTRGHLLSVFRKVCDAVAFAHARRILHRDLKPENIMVGEFGEVLVMDWGLAKVIGEHEAHPPSSATPAAETDSDAEQDFGMTMEGEVLGTPQYMSPEQALGRLSELDERSDIYSLGGVLYAILTFLPPVEGKTLEEVLTRVRSGEISAMGSSKGKSAASAPGKAPPAEMGGGIPDALRAVTRKAMALDQAERYGSVREFIEDIDAFQHGYATRAERAGPLRQIQLLVQRHQGFAAMLGLLLLFGVGFAVKLFASERIATENAQKAQQSARLASENAEQAVREKESARRAATSALLALAEAAERELDGEEMQRTLAEIPVELREQKWEYLNGKLDTADLKVAAKDGAGWMSMVPHPQKPGVMVTLQSNGWVRTLDLRSGECLNLVKTNPVALLELVAFSGDGKIALARANRAGSVLKGVVVEVSLPDGKKGATIRLEPCTALRLSFSPDNKQLLGEYRLTAPGGTQQVQAWQPQTGAVLWTHSPNSASVAEYSDDGKLVRVFAERDNLRELDAQTGQPVRELGKVPWPFAFSSMVSSVQYAAPADWSALFVYQASPAKFLRRYETATGKLLFENRALELRGMGYLQDSGTLVTLGMRSDRCVVLQYWHGQTGMLIKSVPLLGEFKGGWRLVVNKKSGDVAVINGTKLRAWNFRPSKPLQVMPANNKRGFAFAGEPWRIARALQKPAGWFLELLDTRLPGFDKKPLATSAAPVSGSAMVTSNGDGSILATSGSPARVFSRKDSTLKELFGGQIPQEGWHFQLNNSGTQLWTGNGVFESATGQLLCKMDRKGVEFPPTGAGASEWLNSTQIVEIALVKAEWQGAPPDAVERAILLWDATTGQRLATAYAPDATSLCVSPDGKQLAEAGSDMRIRLRNAQTLAVEKEFRAHDGPVTDVAWHPKQPMLASASEDLNVRFWSLKTGIQLGELHGIASQPEQRPERLTISPNGQFLGVRSAAFGVGFFEPPAFQAEKK
jgi:serine/threonine protein kinase/WD40 repeat protein